MLDKPRSYTGNVRYLSLRALIDSAYRKAYASLEFNRERLVTHEFDSAAMFIVCGMRLFVGLLRVRFTFRKLANGDSK